jgi:glycosyltransferase involved in cell wall biosynthesis
MVHLTKGDGSVSFDHRSGGTAIDTVVLIPAYNAATTIPETLHALQANSALGCIKTVIVLNDASCDDTAAIARASWKSQIPLDIWTNSKNVGERATVNSGFAHLGPTVEWAFILHADDVVKSNWLSLYLELIADSSADIASICSSHDEFCPDTGRVYPGEEYPDRQAVLVRGEREAVLNTLRRGCWWFLSGCAIRTAAFRQVGGFKTDMPQLGDWEWLLRCLAKGFSVSYLPRSTLFYRRHAGSVSSESFRIARDIRERLKVFSEYHDLGYLSDVEYRQEMRHLTYQLTRRTLVRGLRGDIVGAAHHARLLGALSAKLVS